MFCSKIHLKLKPCGNFALNVEIFMTTNFAFCLKDGMPLVLVNPNDENWSGRNKFNPRNPALNKEIRKQQLKKVVSTLITTIIVISVISVITLKSWIYTHPEETAKYREEKLRFLIQTGWNAKKSRKFWYSWNRETTPNLPKTPQEKMNQHQRLPTETPKPTETHYNSWTNKTKTKPLRLPTITATLFVCTQ